MPQAVCINHPFPRRKVHQLQTHRQDNPRYADTRQHRPRAPDLAVLHIAESTPKQIRQCAHHHVRSHIVRVVPAPQAQISHMQDIQQYTQRGPEPQYALFARLSTVETEHADRSVVKSIQHIRAGRPIIQFLRDPKISRVEDHAERPARQAHVSEADVVLPERVARRDLLAELCHAPVVREVVEQAEDDAEGLLYAHEAIERPFAVELVDRLHVGWVAGEAFRGDEVLAGVVAFGGTVPEEEATVEGWETLDRCEEEGKG